MLDQAGIKGGAYALALGAIDGALGTNYKQVNDMTVAMQGAIDQYKKTGDVSAFGNAITGIKDRFEPLDEKVQTTQQHVNDLITTLAGLDRMTVNAYIVTHHIDVNGDGKYTPPIQTPPGGATDPTHDTGMLNGGSYSVPPGHYEDFYVGGGHYASSGETVTVTPASESPSIGGVVNNWNITGSNAEEIAYKVKNILDQQNRSARTSGKGYAGRR